MDLGATRMIGKRLAALPADWSWQRKAALVVFALIMIYLHSLYILFFYVTDWDYWWPFWTGMTGEQRLLSYALALFANLGLITMPFVRAPGRILRAVIALSLTMGLLVSVAWIARDLGTFGLLSVGRLPTTEHIGRFLADVHIARFTNTAQGVIRQCNFLELLVPVQPGETRLRTQESRSMADSAGSAVDAIEDAAIDGFGLRDAVDGALREARNSGLPGLAGGPADAYRHLIITGEIVRRYGPDFGPPLAAMHEALSRVAGQTQADEDMDSRNNRLVADAPEFRTWEDVVAWARAKILDAAEHDGDGQEGRAFWYKKQPFDWHPNFANVPITPIGRGGPEHKYAPTGGSMTEPMGMADAAGAGAERPGASSSDPLNRAVTSWTEEDVRKVLNSPAYLRPQHPRRTEAERKVRAWFERHLGRRTGSGGRHRASDSKRSRQCRTSWRLSRSRARPQPRQRQGRGGRALPIGAGCLRHVSLV